MIPRWLQVLPALVWTLALLVWVYRRDMDYALVCGVIACVQWDRLLKGRPKQ